MNEIIHFSISNELEWKILSINGVLISYEINMAEEQGHIYGSLESMKFDDIRVKTIPKSWMPNVYIIK